MKVIIAGRPKTGTTLLAYRLKAALADSRLDFEPLRRRRAREHDRNLVTKILITHTKDLQRALQYSDFDRHLCVLRDPRDQLISQTFYAWFQWRPEQRYARFMELLRMKERDPQSVDFVELVRVSISLEKMLASALAATKVLVALQRRGWRATRYEDFAQGDWRPIEDFMGVTIDSGAKVGPERARVIRSRSAGNWRRWLTPGDLTTLRPRLAEIMGMSGYEDDWTLEPVARLDAKIGSDYVRALRPPVHRLWLITANRFLKRVERKLYLQALPSRSGSVEGSTASLGVRQAGRCRLP